MNDRARPFRSYFNALRLAAAALTLCMTGGAVAQGVASQTPAQLEGVGVDQKLGDKLPLDLTFTDDQGKTVTLGDYINGKRPVILTPVYYNCPQLCTLVLNGLVDGLNRVELNPGKDFDIVTFSFAPEEAVELANRKKRAYLTQYKNEGAAQGWHFLVGSEQSVTKLCDAVGFKSKRQPDGTIAHTASIMFITPDGTISKYMNDVMFEPRDLRLALVDASKGTISAPLDNFLLFTCFKYDPASGSYVASAWKIMRSGGVVTLVLLGGGLLLLFKLESKKRASSARHGQPQAGTAVPAAEGGWHP